MKKLIYLSLIVYGGFSACKPDAGLQDENQYYLEIPKGFPAPVIPADNAMTKRRVALGKKLFFDPILSLDSSISCGSCHSPSLAFSDTNKFSIGVQNRIGERNASSLSNVAYQQSFFWDGGVPSLEQQAIAPIENHLEMAFNLPELIKRLSKHNVYPNLFQQAYGRQVDVFSLVRALACYERTLISGNSAYDKFLYGDSLALTTAQGRGFEIFTGEKGECFHCHAEFNFTDGSFKNNGLYDVYADSGRARISAKSSDVGKFKVPSLRNVELSAPYMHDGSLRDLQAVVKHYNSGGKNHPNKSILIKPLNLNAQEQSDLVEFLKALTDKDFIEKNRN